MTDKDCSRSKLIDCFVKNISALIMADNDYDYHESWGYDYFAILKETFNELKYNKQKIEEILNAVKKDRVIQLMELCEDLDEEEARGDEFDIAMDNIRTQLGL